MHYDQNFPRCCQAQTPDRFASFRRLPAEIRMMIWEYALPDARVYEVLDAPNAKQKTPAQQGLMFANVHPEPPPALAAVCQESRYFVLRHYKPLTLGTTTKFVDMARDMLLLEPYLLVKRLHRTLHFMSQIPLLRDHTTRLALGTSYGIYPGIFHPVLGRKVSKNNMSKLLSILGKFPKLKTLIFIVHQEFQFDFDFCFPGTMTPIPSYNSAATASPPGLGLGSAPGYRPSPPASITSAATIPPTTSNSTMPHVHQAYRFKFDIEANINNARAAPHLRPRHANELLYYPLDTGALLGRREGEDDDDDEMWDLMAAAASAAAGGGEHDEEEEGEWCDPWPTNDDWRRFRRRFLGAMVAASYSSSSSSSSSSAGSGSGSSAAVGGEGLEGGGSGGGGEKWEIVGGTNSSHSSAGWGGYRSSSSNVGSGWKGCTTTGTTSGALVGGMGGGWGPGSGVTMFGPGRAGYRGREKVAGRVLPGLKLKGASLLWRYTRGGQGVH
ncbi:hypothetical protein N656DRAFT_700443 [Canariomyces notabilis]|uniref:2EXR domain-containing protein n=1 Tax=Canariomyces notabilis TaxID=2074819 RepID=A0AAN6YWD5_9PEZI|nr:hypothetical protein N656DRAFT_700443 [Canariomyces arenarius]